MTSPARAAAFEVLLRVETTDSYASELLHSPRFEKLSPADHGLATEIVMGVLRWRSRLDETIAAASSQKLAKLDCEVLTALRMAAYQIQFLSRVPRRAAVHESVELVKLARKRSAAAFVNAVLRKLAAKSEPASPNPPDAAGAGAFSHPTWLVERWGRELGLPAAEAICLYDQRPPAITIRLTSPEVETELRREDVELLPGLLLSSARRIAGGDLFASAAWREGRVQIQDEASQLVALLAGHGERILDCCAAPGGKTRILAEENPGTAVTAVELHAHRARLLRKLVPNRNVEVVHGDITQLTFPETFDRVLADVPCSGTGTLARNPEIKWRLRPEDLQALQSRQVSILRAAARHLSPGGRLVYSTCSLEGEENAQVIEEILAQDSSLHVLDCRHELRRLQTEGKLIWADLDSLVNAGYLRTLPGNHPCDGFFAAVLQKS
jgi:16S rRNA (cytosine967-C5)-methyltransferase